MAERLYALAEAAVELDMTLAAVRHAADRGALATMKIGSQRVVTASEIERYRRENKGRRGRPAGAKDRAPRKPKGGK